MKRFPHIWKFNWRLIVLHVVATFLLFLSVVQIARLTALPLLGLIHKNGDHFALHIKDPSHFHNQVIDYYTWLVYLPLAMLILIFILSLIISIRNKLSVLNAVIVLIVSYFASSRGLFFNNTTRIIFFFPGNLLLDSSLLMSAIINGTYLFALSLFLLYSRFIKQHWVLRQQQKIARQLLDE
jgi:hypothetical protein